MKLQVEKVRRQIVRKKPGMRRGRVPERQRTKVEKGEERSQVRKGVTVSSCCPSVS